MTTNLVRLANWKDPAVANDPGVLQTRLEAMAAAIATHPSWSQTDTWLRTDDTAVIIGDGTSELCLATSTANNINAANSFLAAALGNDDLMISFCPNGTFGGLDNANNPWDDATFCSDAGAFSFQHMQVANNVTTYYSQVQYWAFLVQEGTIIMVGLAPAFTSKYSQFAQVFFASADHGFQSLAIGGDTDVTIQATIPVSHLTFQQNVNSFTLGSTSSHLSCAFFVGGTLYEDGDFAAALGTLDWLTADFAAEAGKAITVDSATVAGGTKGDIDQEYLALCREDAPAGVLGPVTAPTHQSLHRGICVGIQPTGRQVM